jgi:N-acetylmuramoyl-L-alanine amidase
MRRPFDVWHEVPLVPQLTGMSCWAAAAAMLVGWRDCLDVRPEDVAAGLGRWDAYRDGLVPRDVVALARAFGLVIEPARSYGTRELFALLERVGPLWVGEAVPGLHVVVVAGMHGDGTPEGTWVRVADPWPIGKGERYQLRFPEFCANLAAAAHLVGPTARVLHVDASARRPARAEGSTEPCPSGLDEHAGQGTVCPSRPVAGARSASHDAGTAWRTPPLLARLAGTSGGLSTSPRHAACYATSMRNESARIQLPLPGLVVIDAGHGGDHTLGTSTPYGARGPAGSLEKDVTLALARRVAAHLGSRALLTRSDDRNLSLGARAALARQHGASVFVSLHANGSDTAGRGGTEAYVHTRGGGSCLALAGALRRRLARFGGGFRLPERGELAILTPERLPRETAACLLEVDDISSHEGERRLSDPRALDDVAFAIATGIGEFLEGQRYGDVGVDPSAQPPTTKRADPAKVAEQLLSHYLGPYLNRLGDEAKRRLVEAWRESPGGVIAAGAILGAAGIGYVVGTGSSIPALPAIPLDALGGIFQGAELKLKLDGPVTNPDAFQFVVTFRERVRRQPARSAPAPREYIDELLAGGPTPEQIATQIDGPEFETEVPGQGPSSDIALYLGEFVRGIGNALLEEVKKDPEHPWIDLGELPPLPADFGRGLQRIIDALVDAVPSRFGSIQQVSFITRVGGEVRWHAAIPRAWRRAPDEPGAPATSQGLEARLPRPARGNTARSASRFGDGDARCLLHVEFPTEIPEHRHAGSSFRISNNSPTNGRLLFDNDWIALGFDNFGSRSIRCEVVISDDEGNGILCQSELELAGGSAGFIQFSRFPLRADQTTRMTSCRYQVTVVNLYRSSEGVELWMREFT